MSVTPREAQAFLREVAQLLQELVLLVPGLALAVLNLWQHLSEHRGLLNKSEARIAKPRRALVAQRP